MLLADDQHLVREALAHYIQRLLGDVAITEASTLNEALGKIDEGGPFDVVVLDWCMPGMNTQTAIAMVRERLPGTPIVIMSGYITKEDAAAALRQGAAGVIPKDLRGLAMINALRLVLSGEVFLPSSLFAPAGNQTEHETQGRKTAANVIASGNLSAREGEILSFLCKGLSNRQIAAQLSISENTVKVHLRKTFRKIGARNRSDAVRIALAFDRN